LKKPIFTPLLWDFCGGKGKLLAVLSLHECNNLQLTSNESNSVKIGSTASGSEQNLGSQKISKTNSLEPFFAISILKPNDDVISDVISGFAKVVNAVFTIG